MDASDGRPSPRSRQLQGPRPPRLAVSKDSHKVRKPPVVPQPRGGGGVVAGPSRPQQQQQPRAPVIIYDASPKVIHTRPSEFMALVQRLTGPGSAAVAAVAAPVAAGFHAEASSSSSASASALPPQFQLPQEFMLSPTAALSPAARYAAIERSVRPLPPTTAHYYTADADDPILLDVDGDAAAFAAALGPARPSILSPVPSALPPAASSGLFSPLDQASLSWLSDLSPFLHSAGAAAAPPPPFAPSPRSLLLSTPTMPSPATFSVMEFFSSNFPDL
ncbi:protein MKS1-like [Oryza glaberrima]|uniref:VQ domain-containing protein n=3 Tax=Oryza TaxID=4527 RepID=A0A0E0GMY3_ORYNI|nr:protein MKS1-like [Oryza glaberrima]